MSLSSLSERIFNLMLAVYPREFRHDYGPQMAQVFRDCCRAQEQKGLAGGWDLWLRTLTDVLVSATKEHLATFRKENSTMNNWQRTLMAFCTCLAIIVVAF